jgi:hypothetical protein
MREESLEMRNQHKLLARFHARRLERLAKEAMTEQPKKIVTITHMVGNSVYKNRWHVLGSAKFPYVVSETTHGDWLCSCPAWTKNSPREDCKHIFRVKLERALSWDEHTPAVTMASNPSLRKITYSGRKMR